jgi:ABC-type dipeptide/oligopeptide/nickel transport system permease component
MATFIVRRCLSLIPVLIGVSFLVFAAMYIIPGDAVDSMVAETGASAEDLARLREQLGLDDPFLVQYGRFLGTMARGDLGQSLVNGRSVAEQLRTQLPATVELTLAALAVAIVLGLPLGILAAVKRGTWVDGVSMVIALVGVSMPNFWLGLLFIMLFSLRLGWFPVAGTGGLDHLVLPALTLGLSGTAVIARVSRSSLLEVLSRDYMRTAKAKGLAPRRVINKHALRNALSAVLTLVGLQFGALLGGSVVVETVFGRQGIGFLTANAIQRGDFPLVQAAVLLAAFTFVFVNLLIDISYSLLDPRIHYG